MKNVCVRYKKVQHINVLGTNEEQMYTSWNWKHVVVLKRRFDVIFVMFPVNKHLPCKVFSHSENIEIQ